MAKIKFVDSTSRKFETFGSRAERDEDLRDVLDRLPPRHAEGSMFTHHAGGEGQPQLVEVRFPPNFTHPAHAHDEDEIVYIVQGSLRFGARNLGVGSSIYIPRSTLYSFATGPEGVTFLNFRRSDTGNQILFKDDVAERRLARRTGPAKVVADATP